MSERSTCQLCPSCLPLLLLLLLLAERDHPLLAVSMVLLMARALLLEAVGSLVGC